LFTDTFGVNPVTSSAYNVFNWQTPIGQQTISISNTQLNLQTNFGGACSASQQAGAASLPTLISYPDSTSLQIGYEPTPGYSGDYTGRIGSLTLRTGGLISYTYGPMNCYVMAPSTLTRTDASGTTTYTLSSGGSSDTVIDPVGNKTVHYFTGIWATSPTATLTTEIRRFINIGTPSSPSYAATPDDDELYCYNGNLMSCQTATVTYPIAEKDI
jgi:hypothetical protein